MQCQTQPAYTEELYIVCLSSCCAICILRLALCLLLMAYCSDVLCLIPHATEPFTAGKHEYLKSHFSFQEYTGKRFRSTGMQAQVPARDATAAQRMASGNQAQAVERARQKQKSEIVVRKYQPVDLPGNVDEFVRPRGVRAPLLLLYGLAASAAQTLEPMWPVSHLLLQLNPLCCMSSGCLVVRYAHLGASLLLLLLLLLLIQACQWKAHSKIDHIYDHSFARPHCMLMASLLSE